MNTEKQHFVKIENEVPMSVCGIFEPLRTFNFDEVNIEIVPEKVFCARCLAIAKKIWRMS